MKRITTLLAALCLCCSGSILAQPVLINTMSPYPVGTVDSIYNTSATVAPGSGGAGVTWNFSSLSPGAALGVVNIVTPGSTPYTASFPSANFCARITPNGSSTLIYTYDRISSTLWETLANNYSGPGTGKNYTPNPESNLEFPMSYLTTFTDTYQTTTAGPYTTVITYDGYGTLITPFTTYSNVVRIERYWGPGDYDYDWYVTSPYLGIVMSYNAQSNAYTLIGNGTPSSVKMLASENMNVNIVPNPAKDFFTLTIDKIYSNCSLTICSITGTAVKQMPIDDWQTKINTAGMSPGMYFWHISCEGKNTVAGKLIIE